VSKFFKLYDSNRSSLPTNEDISSRTQTSFTKLVYPTTYQQSSNTTLNTDETKQSNKTTSNSKLKKKNSISLMSSSKFNKKTFTL